MNDKEKASALLQFMEDEWDGKAIINALNPYLKDEDLAGLYDNLQKDGVIRDEDPDDDVPEEMKKALKYVRSQLKPEDLALLRAHVDKAYVEHGNYIYDDSKVIDLLEEYGENEDLPEGWWEELGDIDDWMTIL